MSKKLEPYKAKCTALASILIMNVFDHFPRAWTDYLYTVPKSKAYISRIKAFTEKAYAKSTVYPPKIEVFKALSLIDPLDVKVVILGQDPYHGENQAHGLAFSVPDGTKIPPSLLNILKEVKSDIGSDKDFLSGSLVGWAKQGVLLLNSNLTVEAGKANSHAGNGWEDLVQDLLIGLSIHKNIVFIAWGKNAKDTLAVINPKDHCMLYAAHPSPLSAYKGFFGCRHFSKANEYLISKDKSPIDWSQSSFIMTS